MMTNCYIYKYEERLEKAIEKSGLSKTQIATRCGIDRKCFYPYNHRMMTSGNLAKFCAVTGVSADWLLGLSKEMMRK